MRPLSFRIKLALWAAGLCGVVLLVFVTASAFIVYDNMLEEANSHLKNASSNIIQEARAGTFDADLRAESIVTISAEDAEMRLLHFFSPSGETYHAPGWPTLDHLQPKHLGNFESIDHGGSTWQVIHRSSEAGFRVILAVELTEINREVTRMTGTYLSALPLALLFMGLGAWWVAGKASKPVAAITSAAESITAGALSERIPEPTSEDELGRLTLAFNTMMDKLETSFHQASRFSSDASHELRTPIAVLQGKIEEALHRPDATDASRETLAGLLEQTQRLKSIVQSLLLFSRSDSGRLGIDRDPIVVPELLADLEEDMSFLLEESEITFEIDASEHMPIKGDPRLLRLALFNVFQNASKFNGSADGRIRCETSTDSNSQFITISNTGEKISEDDQRHIFDRFYRAENSETTRGYGLGLSLARVIAEAHGGALELSRSDGEWNAFTFSLPLATD